MSRPPQPHLWLPMGRGPAKKRGEEYGSVRKRFGGDHFQGLVRMLRRKGVARLACAMDWSFMPFTSRRQDDALTPDELRTAYDLAEHVGEGDLSSVLSQRFQRALTQQLS